MAKLSWKSPKLTIRMVTLSALLVAMQVILTKLVVGNANVLEIGLDFIGTAIIGYITGPWLGGVLLVINDIISNTILTSGSTFFPGFTFSAFISGVIAGMFLYQQKITWQRVFIYEFVQILISNVIFTTLWVYLLSLTSAHHMSLGILLSIRLPKEIISWPIEAAINFFILRALTRLNLHRNIV